jgi:hypothetical protein
VKQIAVKDYMSVTLRQLVITLLLSLLPSAILAQAWDAKEVNAHRGQFLLGVISGVSIHEAGHFAVAYAQGISPKWHNLSIVYPVALTDREHLRVASAGFQAQWVMSEMVLRRYERADDKAMGAFETGMVVSHLATTAAYLTILKDHPEGDLTGVSAATGISTDELALLVAIPAALDAWRLFGKDIPAWVPTLSAGYKGLGMAAVWTF